MSTQFLLTTDTITVWTTPLVTHWRCNDIFILVEAITVHGFLDRAVGDA